MTFDRFHVMKIVNSAVDEVRLAEQIGCPELVKTRYVWLRNPRNWAARQREIFEQFHPKHLNLKTARAYHLKLGLQELWGLPVGLAEALLQRWIRAPGVVVSSPWPTQPRRSNDTGREFCAGVHLPDQQWRP